jgi:hypothetical protein
MHLIFEPAILITYPLDLALIYQSHHIEKKWNIYDRIEHRDDLAPDCVWDEITESYSGSSDNREVKCVEITLSDRVPYLKIMYCKCPNDPAYQEPHCNGDDLLVMGIERHSAIDMI